MALKDWKKNVEMKDKISYENKKTGDETFITPKDFRRPNSSWELYRPGKIGVYVSMIVIAYRGKMEAKRALKAFLKSH